MTVDYRGKLRRLSGAFPNEGRLDRGEAVEIENVPCSRGCHI